MIKEKPVHWKKTFNKKRFVRDTLGFDKWIEENYKRYHQKNHGRK